MNDRAYASNGLPNGRYLPQQHGVPVAGQPAIAMHPDLAHLNHMNASYGYAMPHAMLPQQMHVPSVALLGNPHAVHGMLPLMPGQQFVMPMMAAQPSPMQQSPQQQPVAGPPPGPIVAPVVTPENKERARQLLAEGHMLRSRNKFSEAVASYNQALKLDPANVEAMNCKGLCYKNLNANEEAMICFRDAMRVAPDDWRAHNNRAVVYKEACLFQESIEAYKIAIQLYFWQYQQLLRQAKEEAAIAGQPATDATNAEQEVSVTNLLHTGALSLNPGVIAPGDCASKEHLAVVLTDLGTRLKVSGNVDSAILHYNDAIHMNPKYAPAYFNLGVVFSEKGRYAEALKFYNLAVERNPAYVEALCNIGVIYKNAGQLETAIHYYERALKANPNFSIANTNLAIAYTDMGTKVKNEGRMDEGIRYYQRSLVHNSKYPDAWYNLGVAHAESGRVEDAMVCYEMAVAFNPGCAQAYNNLGVIYKDRGNLEKSIFYYLEALKANPNFAQTLNNLGVIHTMLGKLDEAYAYCQKAITTNPNYAEAFNNLGVLYRDEGRIREAIACYNNCLKLDAFSRSAGQNRLLAMNSLVPEFVRNGSTPTTPSGIDPSKPTPSGSASAAAGANGVEAAGTLTLSGAAAANGASGGASTPVPASPARPVITFEQINRRVAEHHRNWGLQFMRQYPPFDTWDNQPTTDRPLKIGYLSADFFTHSVSYFIEAALRYANPARTQVICYSNVASEDDKTHRLKKLAHAWRPVVGKSSKEVAALVRKDEIDILVDLTGHTAGNRLDVMSHKPAPVQVAWIGYPNTTGLPTIEYRITDDIADAVDSKQGYVEELVRMPPPYAFLCYTPTLNPPEVAPTPALKNGFVTFGSFNNLAKMNDRVLSLWSQIIQRVPNSRLLMKCKPFACESIRQKMLARFESFGIESKRVDLIPLLPATTDHLKVYNMVDISVDTFPYAGTTTTCEALFMGVPVVTLKSHPPHSSHAHNVGVSLLSRIAGMKEFIADSPEQYVNIAVAFGKDVPRLAKVRAGLRSAMLASPLCDGEGFTRALDGVYTDIWARWCRNAPARAAARRANPASTPVGAVLPAAASQGADASAMATGPSA